MLAQSRRGLGGAPGGTEAFSPGHRPLLRRGRRLTLQNRGVHDLHGAGGREGGGGSKSAYAEAGAHPGQGSRRAPAPAGGTRFRRSKYSKISDR